MRKLIVEEWMSLDGFLTDRENRLNFFTDLASGQNTYSDQDQLKFLESVDLIILGRKTYELFVEFWPEATTDKEVIADQLNQIPKVVFSNTISTAAWGKWNTAQVISGDAADAVRNLKQQKGKNMVIWGSISLAQSLMKANLIDEYRIQLCPVLTGGGRSLFSEGFRLTHLRLEEVRRYNTGTVFLNYKSEI